MANWNVTILKCGNPEAVKACASAIRRSDKNEGQWWKDGDTELCAQTTNGVPHEKIKGISKHFPDAVITCRYSYEHDQFSEIHIVKYCAGQDTVVGIEPNYMSSGIPLDNEKDRDEIYEKAVAFCRRLDVPETDKEGKLFLNWFSEEVCYKFEYDGEDSKKYRVEATKDRERIDFKVFEGLVKYDWREATRMSDDIPF